MAKKLYSLPDATVEQLHEIMEQKGFKTEVSAIVFLINNYCDTASLADEIIEAIESKYHKLFTRLRLGVGAAQKNSHISLDILNSLLYESETVNLLKASGDSIHPVTAQAEKDYRSMIEKNKQIKDNEELQKGE